MLKNLLIIISALCLLFPSLGFCESKIPEGPNLYPYEIFIPWAHFKKETPFQILKELEEILPKEILIRSIDLKLGSPKEKSKIRIFGIAPSSDYILEVIKKLNSSKFYKNASLISSEEMAIDDHRYYMQFQIENEIENPELNNSKKKEDKKD